MWGFRFLRMRRHGGELKLVILVVGLFTIVGCTGSFQSIRTGVNANAPFSVEQRSCGTTFAPAKVQVHLLSNDEYNNSVADLLYTNKIGSDLGIFEARAPGPSGFLNDTSAFTISDLTIEKYWDAAVALANDVIASKSTSNGAYSKIAPCAVGVTAVPSTCVDSVVRNLGLRAWHRPLSEAGSNNEFSRLKAIVTAATNFDTGLNDLIKALLISPNFLFVSITSAQSTSEGAVFNLDNYQLATRLSYFLWQSIPDDQMLADAAAGRLTQPSVLSATVARMLADPKSQRLSNTMANEWAHLASLSNLATPGLDAGIKVAMETETRMMFNEIVRSDASLINLTSSKSSFLNQALANYYGVPFSGADPSKFYKTSLASTNRTGIFGHGSFLVLTSGSPTETRPVKRGKAVANDWICSDIAPPPPNVEPAGDLSTLPANATPRQVLAVHTASASCRGCHNVLDPYGFALETYDPFGKPRTVYASLGNAPIDSSGVLVNGFGFQSTNELINYVSKDQATKTCLARKIMSLALTRSTANSDDRCIASVISQSYAETKFSDVVQAIVASRQFQTQKGEAP